MVNKTLSYLSVVIYCHREEVIKASFFVGISGSNSTVINFATETALTVEQVTTALETVTLKDSTTFAEITFQGEIETVMRKVDLQSVTFAQKVTKESFENITKVFQATWEQQFPGKFRITIPLSVSYSVLLDANSLCIYFTLDNVISRLYSHECNSLRSE